MDRAPVVEPEHAWLSVRVTVERRDDLAERAWLQRTTISDLVRRALDAAYPPGSEREEARP
jgi:hypothetical protein